MSFTYNDIVHKAKQYHITSGTAGSANITSGQPAIVYRIMLWPSYEAEFRVFNSTATSGDAIKLHTFDYYPTWFDAGDTGIRFENGISYSFATATGYGTIVPVGLIVYDIEPT